MAIIKCTSCGVMISDKNSFCPHCGTATDQVSTVDDHNEHMDYWKIDLGESQEDKKSSGTPPPPPPPPTKPVKKTTYKKRTTPYNTRATPPPGGESQSVRRYGYPYEKESSDDSSAVYTVLGLVAFAIYVIYVLCKIYG